MEAIYCLKLTDRIPLIDPVTHTFVRDVLLHVDVRTRKDVYVCLVSSVYTNNTSINM